MLKIYFKTKVLIIFVWLLKMRKELAQMNMAIKLTRISNVEICAPVRRVQNADVKNIAMIIKLFHMTINWR